MKHLTAYNLEIEHDLLKSQYTEEIISQIEVFLKSFKVNVGLGITEIEASFLYDELSIRLTFDKNTIKDNDLIDDNIVVLLKELGEKEFAIENNEGDILFFQNIDYDNLVNLHNLIDLYLDLFGIKSSTMDSGLFDDIEVIIK